MIPSDGSFSQTSPPEAFTVLVVDDEPSNVDLARRWLHVGGYRTLSASSGADALTLVDNETPDLILLDVTMPHMDGFEVYKEFRSLPHLAAIPVMFLTARTEAVDRLRGLRSGAVDYLSKPYNGEELLARVSIALNTKDERDRLIERTKALQEQSIRDALTGLYNRRLLSERLTEEVSRAERYNFDVSCLMIDIDRFKCVNDTLGHAAGDELLRRVAGVILSCARSSDFVSRYGGEEFSLILPQTGSREAFDVAERIRSSVLELKVADVGLERPLSVSIGGSTYPAPGVGSAASLIEFADQALLKAKGAGKNRTVLASPEGPDIPLRGPRMEPNRKVLIVEDEPNNQALLQKVLTRMGYEWVCVGDGNEAVSQSASRPFALILMDLSLPVLDGWQATRLIRAAGSTVPIIATTAHAMSNDRTRAMEAGCNEYITKPFNLSELRRALERFAPLTPGTGAAS